MCLSDLPFDIRSFIASKLDPIDLIYSSEIIGRDIPMQRIRIYSYEEFKKIPGEYHYLCIIKYHVAQHNIHEYYNVFALQENNINISELSKFKNLRSLSLQLKSDTFSTNNSRGIFNNYVCANRRKLANLLYLNALSIPKSAFDITICTKLNELTLCVSDQNDLSKFPDLEYLELMYRDDVDLSHNKKLEILKLYKATSYNLLDTINESCLKNLKLHINNPNGPVDDTNPIFTKIYGLSYSFTNPFNVSRLTNLQYLDCSNTSATDISELVNLRVLVCNNTLISDVSRLTKLDYLECMKTKIVNVNTLINLRFLNCTSTDVADVSRLVNLFMLICPFTLITSVVTLLKLRYLNTRKVHDGIERGPRNPPLIEFWRNYDYEISKEYYINIQVGVPMNI
jgi:hypothetical protein